MTIVIAHTEYSALIGGQGNTLRITMQVEQAKALRDALTRHLRGASRDKEDAEVRVESAA